MPDLHEAHAALQQPAGDQDLPRLRARAVHLADVLRLARHVEGVGRLHLHAVGQLERLDARFELRVVCLAPGALVELLQQVELLPLLRQRAWVVRMCSISFSIVVCWVSM